MILYFTEVDFEFPKGILWVIGPPFDLADTPNVDHDERKVLSQVSDPYFLPLADGQK